MEGGGILDAIGQFFRDWWLTIVEFFMACFNTLWDMLSDALAFVMEQLLGVVSWAIAGANGFLSFNPMALVPGIPGDVANIFGLIGIGPATTMIATAIVIRLLLQLIPFVRLGS